MVRKKQKQNRIQMANKALEITRTLLQKDFNLADPLEEVDNQDALKKQMIPVLDHLLNHDMEKLLLVAYRIDLNETEFKAVLSNSNPDNLSANLADMIIAREMEKAITRLQYRS